MSAQLRRKLSPLILTIYPDPFARDLNGSLSLDQLLAGLPGLERGADLRHGTGGCCDIRAPRQKDRGDTNSEQTHSYPPRLRFASCPFGWLGRGEKNLMTFISLCKYIQIPTCGSSRGSSRRGGCVLDAHRDHIEAPTAESGTILLFGIGSFFLSALTQVAVMPKSVDRRLGKILMESG